MNTPKYVVLTLLGLAASPLAQADGLDTPFATANQSPFVQVYGLPATQGAMLTADGEFNTGLQFDLSNNFATGYEGGESLWIDGETYRANLQMRYGLSDAFEVGMDVPLISHTGGSLDGLIDSWHDLWGLPDGGRANVPNDQLHYAYYQGDQMLAQVSDSKTGIGDLSLSLGYRLAANEKRQWALRTSVKLPTGDARWLMGSESTDVAAGLYLTDLSLVEKHDVTWHASGGLLKTGSSQVLDELREDWVAFGSLAFSWRASQRLSLKLQFDAHTGFYDSVLKELGSESVQLVLGGAFGLSENWVMDLAVSEDIIVGTASDVVIHIAIRGAEW